MATTAYPTYAYRVEAFYSESGAWDVVKDDARGVEEYDGTAEDFAREVLGNHVDDLHTLEDAYPGPYRVLVWEGRSEGLLEDAAVAEAEQIGKPNRGGRPSTGRAITVRLPEAHIDALDALAVERGTTRPALIREAVARLLEADPDPAEERWEIQVHYRGQWKTWHSGTFIQMLPEVAAAELGAIHLLRGHRRARNYDRDELGRPVWRLVSLDAGRVWEGEEFARRVAEVLLRRAESQASFLRDVLDN